MLKLDANIKCADKKANLGRRSPLGQKAGGLQYEHLSTVVGEEAWHTLAEVSAQLKKAVDQHIRESLEQVESQVQGALQSVLRQRISELLR